MILSVLRAKIFVGFSIFVMLATPVEFLAFLNFWFGLHYLSGL